MTRTSVSDAIRKINEVVTTVSFEHDSLEIIEKNFPLYKTANEATFKDFFSYSPVLGCIPFCQQIKATLCFSNTSPNRQAEGAVTKSEFMLLEIPEQ